ncbi:similar to Saccharomyces cerevisiae YNL050C Putative protein of unknown function [Maudiozyma saulgeensis]|uniref:Uncharacterized protein n=1 Tax=Maudiozyma saulgeensis TaxID=1789683 RepID=A0A1X7R967_9SACH|nr:similar to Saccharomyces cerevisiae YNL050C Putative protein of unknown function [Kazachstania saulgeensis]
MYLFQEGGTSPINGDTENVLIPELEFVEVSNVGDPSINDMDNNKVEDEQEANDGFEFFPLFATEELTKVDLTEQVDDLVPIIQKRRESYYFASYNDLQTKEFEKAGITYDQLIEMSRTPYKRYRDSILNINTYNATIEEQNIKEKKAKKRKPGKNQRMARKQAKLNIAKRDDLRKQLKKKFRKRGGKKNKKKEKMNPLLHAGALPADAMTV